MRLPKPSGAMLVAFTALVVALGGSATAARTLITGKDIAPGAITSKHLAPGAVTSRNIASGAVTRAKLARGARPVQVAAVPGPQGPPGPPGPAGLVDLRKIHQIQGPTVTVPAGEIGLAVADCPAGEKVTGGGYFVSIAAAAATLPHPSATSWGVIVNNTFNSIPVDVEAYAICVAP
jgi:hypothetical protein